MNKLKLKNGVIKKEKRTITWLEFSKDNQYLAALTENKQLIVFNTEFEVVNNITLARVASKVCFSPKNDIIVADRTGDVFLYKLHQKTEPTFLLGHLSMILDLLVTECGNYIITCDRDEKIRVSHYPNAYNIQTFCLGHEEFVTSLKLLKNSEVLLSASGDGTVRMWNYKQGKQLNIIDTGSLVDEEYLQRFAKEMDLVENITKLPIVDMQLNENVLALFLHSVPKLFLYTIDSITFNFLGSIDVNTTQFSYSLCNSLYILSKSKFDIYCPNKFNKVSGKQIEDTVLDLVVIDNNDITILYKRKFDNVQEYMERKKRRLEAK
ncbi:unnamed protein product [Ceutorhynchus assimilis]|uniref:tRNA (guanine-N(7)-)-methyltransferase non-catalytic subunit wuho n=1 Tax=Ceutorhynchus assimilis TaxID=467358 RepID=A0A9N9QJT8_9CUCU|nr:unnamed protein product [Ceutorhynchus assimilis]